MKKPLLIRSKKRNKIKYYFFRVRFLKTHIFRWFLHIIIKTNYVEKQFKLLAIFLIVNLINKSAISKHKNVCLLSSWTRSVNNFTRLNRLTFRDKAAKLYIPGIVNANW